MKKIAFLLFLIPILFSSCQKKGYINIKNSGFWINNCTAPFEVQFYLDVNYQPKEITYHWDFGDGTNSDEKEPLHNFTKTGKYNVKLQIVNYKTVVDKEFVIDVSQDPMPIQADFGYESTHNNYFAPCEIQFTNNSQYASKFFWDFGDGKGSDQTGPTHIFDTAGTYNVYLHAICGKDTASTILKLDIDPPPSKISIDVVSIWLPEEYIGGTYKLEYYSGIHLETPIDLQPVKAEDYPFGWNISDDLYFFDGNYDSQALYFEIYDYYDDNIPIYSFGKKFKEIQQAFYPDTLSWNGENGYSAEVLVSYEQ